MAIVNFVMRESDIPAGVAAEKVQWSHDTVVWVWQTYVGRCVAEREENGYNDSDFYMTVQEADGSFRETCFASTRGWTYPAMGSRVDATPEVAAAYAAHRAQVERAQRERWAAEEAKLPKKGRTVRVVRGRKVPVGTVGQVFWVGEGVKRYGMTQAGRIGIETPSGRVFTAATNVEVV